jgi:hypothetical protein
MTNGSSNAGAHATRWVLAATILSGFVGTQGCAHSGPPAGAPPGTLEVGVFNQRGEPMPGLPIKVERADGGWQQEAKSSAPQGKFLFRSLTPGAYKISVLGHEKATTQEVQVQSGEAAEVMAVVEVSDPYGDKLDPVDRSAPLDEYDRRLRTVFSAAFRDDVVVQMMSRPAEQPEWIVGLRRAAGGKYEVFRLQASAQVWHEEEEAEVKEETTVKGDGKESAATASVDQNTPKAATSGPKLEDIKAPEKAAPIDAEVAESVAGAWKAVLEQVNPPGKADLGVDGTTYEFAAREPGGTEKRAEKWSPRDASRPGKLVALADKLGRYVAADAKARTSLRGEILALAKELSAAKP